MALMKKLSGGGDMSSGDGDYETEGCRQEVTFITKVKKVR
jgi:hypothetical protein